MELFVVRCPHSDGSGIDSPWPKSARFLRIILNRGFVNAWENADHVSQLSFTCVFDAIFPLLLTFKRVAGVNGIHHHLA